MTNGRSAFSASLAEYVLAAALHFNKRVRCEQTQTTPNTGGQGAQLPCAGIRRLKHCKLTRPAAHGTSS